MKAQNGGGRIAVFFLGCGWVINTMPRPFLLGKSAGVHCTGG